MTSFKFPGQVVVPGLFWRETSIVASQANNAMNFLNISSSAVFRPKFPISGLVWGIHFGMDVAISAGTMDIELFINNAEVTQTTLTNATGTNETRLYSSPIPFGIDQTIDYRYSSDGSLAGITAMNVIALISLDT